MNENGIDLPDWLVGVGIGIGVLWAVIAVVTVVFVAWVWIRVVRGIREGDRKWERRRKDWGR